METYNNLHKQMMHYNDYFHKAEICDVFTFYHHFYTMLLFCNLDTGKMMIDDE